MPIIQPPYHHPGVHQPPISVNSDNSQQYHAQMADYMRSSMNNQYQAYPPPPNGMPYKYPQHVDRPANSNLNPNLPLSQQQTDLSSSQNEKLNTTGIFIIYK